MYSTVSIRTGISWCVQYCVSKDMDLLVCTVGPTVSLRTGISCCVQYCVNKDMDLLVCTVLCH